VQMMHFDLLS